MRIETNISLKPYNTFGIDVKAKEFVTVDTLVFLKELILQGKLRAKKMLILGGGSNVLFTKDFDGVVVKINIGGITVEEEDNNMIRITAGAGVVWDELVHFCMEKGYGGIENLVSIPGSVGAGPIQNIGAYGVELKDTFHSLKAISLTTAEERTFRADDCSFGYRDSTFKKELKGKYIIVSVSLLLSRDHDPDASYGVILDELKAMGVHKPGIRDVGEAVMAIRKRKLPDPEEVGNAGSFFKNPLITEKKFRELRNRYPDIPSYKGKPGMVKVPAGWMIEKCGWKGKALDNVAVHDKQALVLINKGNATGQDVVKLAHNIMDSVMEEFGIELEFEVNVIE